MTQFSILHQIASVDQAPSQGQPTRSELAMALFFIPFAVWVLWVSWKWRREYKELRRERSDLP